MAIFDGTNSTVKRRTWILQELQSVLPVRLKGIRPKCATVSLPPARSCQLNETTLRQTKNHVLFVESICHDKSII
eukprot:SAG31_NODE_19843_length_590_cov_1.030550_2_plen_74_part_01